MTKAKCNKISELRRKEGNENYRLKNFDRAIQSYNLSILFASDNSEQLALAYQNRSSALYETSHFLECRRDVDRALAITHCPEQNREKLLYRKKKSQFNLQGCAPGPSTVAAGSTFQGSPSFPDISVSVELKYEDKRGRFLIASQDIEPGDIIIQEKPYATVFIPQNFDTHCHECHSLLPLDFVPCPKCTQVKFCNEVCRDHAQQLYHYLECTHLDILYDSGLAHLAVRILLFTHVEVLLSYFCDHVLPIPDEKGRFGCTAGESSNTTIDVIFGSNYPSVYNMVTNDDKIDSTDALVYEKVSHLLVGFLKSQKFVDAVCSTAKEAKNVCDSCKSRDSIRRNLQRLILRHLQQLICNGHVITCLFEHINESSSHVAHVEERKIASAVYPSVSLMNHSCEANTFTSFERKTAVVRATRRIQAGQEIFNCYGPAVGRHAKRERQRDLLQQYYFHCRCSGCTSELQRKKELILQAFKCSQCSGPCCKVDNGQMYKCLDCNFCLKDAPVANSAAEAESQFWAAIESRRNVTKICQCLKALESILHDFNGNLFRARDKTSVVLFSEGLYDEAVDLLFENIKAAAFGYGERSVEVGFEIHKLADSLFFDRKLKRRKEILESIEKAVKIFTVYYGQQCSYVKALVEAKNFAETDCRK